MTRIWLARHSHSFSSEAVKEEGKQKKQRNNNKLKHLKKMTKTSNTKPKPKKTASKLSKQKTRVASKKQEEVKVSTPPSSPRDATLEKYRTAARLRALEDKEEAVECESCTKNLSVLSTLVALTLFE